VLVGQVAEVAEGMTAAAMMEENSGKVAPAMEGAAKAMEGVLVARKEGKYCRAPRES